MNNIVFIVAIDTEQRSNDQGYEWSIKSWKKWCENNGHQLLVLDKPIYDLKQCKANWHKLFVYDLLENEGIEYDKIAIVDSDTIVHPDCPNFFDMVGDSFGGVVNPISEWVLRSMEVYSKFVFNNHTLDFWKYINTGFMVMGKNHKEFVKESVDYYFKNKDVFIEIQNKFGVGNDQTPINYLLDINKIDVKLLSYKFNMQELPRKEIITEDLLFTKLGWVYHFNTWPKPNPRYWLEKTYRSLYEQ
jgi:hypothetical protein|tara:strand:- start:753 stop:1487 length:735 start_codon:yes stop_codon:yes gene_type:complete